MAFQLTLANVQQQFEDSLWESSNMLLALVAQDYGLDHKTLRDRYLPEKGVPLLKDGSRAPAPLLVKATEIKAARKSRKTQEKVCCKGTTAKGKPCSFAAVIDGEWCKKHSPKEEGATPAPATKKAKAKAEKPKHNHPVEEAPPPGEICGVCENQGNLVNPEAPREEIEVRGADEIKSRLADILKSASEPEDSEEEEEEEPTFDLNALKQLVEETQEDTPEAETQNLIENDPEISQRLADILGADGDNTDDEEEEEEA